jgi:hypothetical protein
MSDMRCGLLKRRAAGALPPPPERSLTCRAAAAVGGGLGFAQGASAVWLPVSTDWMALLSASRTRPVS